ncbi:MAG: hypothetical protein CMN76_06680 [Spirochaetaceae bacterium]|nr:hypothetical protein [Spirochaetaceae bacterium]|tara:strand:- start:389466 stop:390257 length:792 start_codon:yes stop_codon:yes gene_type:complete
MTQWIFRIFQFILPQLGGASRNLVYSSTILVIANLLIIAGTIFFRWDAWQLMFLFWFESVCIGIIHFMRFLLSAFSPAPDLKNPIRMMSLLFMAFFFLIHFNGFNAGHLVFLVVLPALLVYGRDPDFVDTLLNWTGFSSEAFKHSGDLAVAEPFQVAILAAIFLGHLNSLVVHDFMKKEYRAIPDKDLMMLPYSRIFVMHLTIIFGASLYTGVMTLTGKEWAGIAFLCVFVALKIYFDLKTHTQQHRKREEALSGTAEPEESS